MDRMAEILMLAGRISRANKALEKALAGSYKAYDAYVAALDNARQSYALPSWRQDDVFLEAAEAIKVLRKWHAKATKAETNLAWFKAQLGDAMHAWSAAHRIEVNID